MWELGQEAADHGQGFYLALGPQEPEASLDRSLIRQLYFK